METPKLFMVMVGGKNARAHIELHDIRFVAGATLADTYETLQSEWWGDPDTLHIDVWADITCIDGYNVSLSPAPYKGKDKLFFLNLGGYDTAQFDELHKNLLVVATSQEKAKALAREKIAHWTQPHKDTLFEVEKILPLREIGGLHVHLEKSAAPVPFSFHCRYTPISKKALAKRSSR